MSRNGRRAAAAMARSGEWTPFERQSVVPDPVRFPALHDVTSVWKNSQYIVLVVPKDTEWGAVTLLMVRAHHEQPIRDWAHMQRIKNELVGSEMTAVEVYPPESELVDQANMYHLWVLPAGFRLPFGLDRR